MTSSPLTYNNKLLVDFRCVARITAFLHALADETNEWFEYYDQCNTFFGFEACSQLTILVVMEAHQLVVDELKKKN